MFVVVDPSCEIKTLHLMLLQQTYLTSGLTLPESELRSTLVQHLRSEQGVAQDFMGMQPLESRAVEVLNICTQVRPLLSQDCGVTVS